MLIKPIRLKKNNKVPTNVEICKMMFQSLKDMTNGVGCVSEGEKEKSKLAAIKICGGSQNYDQVMEWLEQINNTPSDLEAQRLIEGTLLQVSNLR